MQWRKLGRLYAPDGRASRTVIAVDIGETPAASDADRRFLLPAEDEVATLGALRALVSAAAAAAVPHEPDPVTDRLPIHRIPRFVFRAYRHHTPISSWRSHSRR